MRRRYEQTKASQQRALQDPVRLEKERERRRRQIANWRARNPERRKELGRISKQRAMEDPERADRIRRNARINRIKRKYQIDRMEAERWLDAIAAGCGICGEHEDEGRRLGLDHCHDTGKIRGWLCGPCNAGIAMLKHDPDLLSASIEYLRHHQGE